MTYVGAGRGRRARQGVDRPLDALAGPEQTPGQQARRSPATASARGPDWQVDRGGVAAPWGMTITLSASTSNPAEQAAAGGLGHHDDDVGERARPARAPSAGAASARSRRCGRQHDRHVDDRRQDSSDRSRRRCRRRCRIRVGRSTTSVAFRTSMQPRRAPATVAESCQRPRRPRVRSVVPHRTTSTVAPCATSPAPRRPRTWRCRTPWAGTSTASRTFEQRSRSPVGEDRAELRGRAPDVGSVETSSLRRATRP